MVNITTVTTLSTMACLRYIAFYPLKLNVLNTYILHLASCDDA